jgi:catechol 2,3-dioxygenase-like lactoylglutathione lyase family enzyme
MKRTKTTLSLWLLLALSFWLSAARAQQSSTPDSGLRTALVTAVEAVGVTVADMDRSLEFYTKVLSFEKVSDVEVWGSEYEQLQGVFGLRMRVVRLRLGGEFLELSEYLAPKGRPIPLDSRSNDRWFQHVAIIVSDMDRAYDWLRKNCAAHGTIKSADKRGSSWLQPRRYVLRKMHNARRTGSAGVRI